MVLRVAAPTRDKMAQIRQGRKSWLITHLEEFVAPVLGYTPTLNKRTKGDLLSMSPVFTPDEMTILKNIWRSVKAEARGRAILLPGRDVFLFEVLARREGYPTIFIPEVSRLTASHFRDRQDLKDCLLFDSGFSGSIPRAMEIGSFALASGVNQVFRNMKGARSLVLKVEGLPKYWKRGFLKHEDGCEDTRVWRSYSEILKGKPLHTCHCIPTVAQELSSHEEFAAAAQVTIQIYTDNSPKSNDTRSPLAAYTGRKYNTGWSQFGQD